MLSLSQIRRPGYFTELASSDYYLEGGERPGEWLSVSAVDAAEGGEVSREELENVLAGLSRDGRRVLVKSHARRVKGWDLTFSAPKSVSVLFAISPRRIRDAILECHREAVSEALQFLVREAIFARRGKQGGSFEPVRRVAVALFPHVTSRASDPNLHTHSLLANFAERIDRTTGAIWSREMYRHKKATGAVYRVCLAHNLQQRVGIRVRRVREWFEVVGMPKAVLRVFSKRSRQIRDVAREFGLSSPKFLELLTKVSQGVKGHLPHAELFKMWQRTARRYGLTSRVIGMFFDWRPFRISPKRFQRVAARAAAKAIDELAQHRSYFGYKDIVERAAPHVMGRGGGVDLLLTAAEVAKKNLIRLETPGLYHEQYTTPELYRAETNVLRIVLRYGKSIGHKPIEFPKLLSILDKYANYGFDPGKRPQRLERLNLEAAVRHLVCSGEQIRFVKGPHQSGSTTALKLAKEALVAAGKEVICLSPTAAGAKALRREVGGDCITVKTFLAAVSPSYRRRASHIARQLWRRARGRDTYKLGEKKLGSDEKFVDYYRNLKRSLRGKLPTFAGKISLGKDTIILLDNGEKLDTRTANELLKIIERKGAAIRIAVAQDSPSGNGPGGVFSHAADKAGFHQLARETRPERETWRRIAHDALADGDAEEFLRQYKRVKALKEAPGLKSAVKTLARDWMDDKVKASDRLVIASTLDEVRRLNKAIQKERRRRRELSRGGIKLPNGEIARKGDLVRFDRKSRWLGVESGDTGRVLKVAVSVKNPRVKRVTVVIDDKKRWGVLPKTVTVTTKRYKHLALGYAVLPHQAETRAKSVRVLLNADHTTRETTLYQLTRSRGKTRLYTVATDLGSEPDLLLDALQRQRTKITAHQFEEQRQRNAGFTRSGGML